MPIRIACPSCKAQLNAPDTAMGKMVKCPKCQTAIKVGDAGPAKKPAPAEDDYDDTPPPKKTSPVKKALDDDYDDYDDEPAPKKKPAARDDDDYDDEPPPAKKGAIKKGRDDDYDDDPPLKKGKSRHDDNYDDEDDYDKPRKSKKRFSGGDYPEPTSEEKTGAFNLCLFTLLTAFVCGPISPIVFLVLWLGKRKENPLLDFHGKQYVNQFITNILVSLVAGVLVAGVGFGLGSIDPTLGIIGAVAVYGLVVVYSLATFIVMIMAMFKAQAGIYYKWPTAFIQALK